MQDQDVTLGELYTDEVTSFSGIATGCTVYTAEPSLIHLENEGDSRWFPVSRINEGAGDQASSQLKQAAENASPVVISVSRS